MTGSHAIVVVFGAAALTALVVMAVFCCSAVVRRRRAERKVDDLSNRLVDADRLAATGTLAAGIAHEINNSLAVILQKSGWIKDLMPEDGRIRPDEGIEVRSAVEGIEEHANRAKRWVQGMLGYARKTAPHSGGVKVNAAVRRTVELVQGPASLKNIRIETDLAQNLPVVAADPAALEQVLLNLMVNAVDAVDPRGRIRVATEDAPDQIRVHVQDDGPGVEEAKQRLVFDPFYTTKPAEKGTGLGLWVSRCIIEEMGGAITVKSGGGRGATFTVRIPKPGSG